jgi:DNA-binding PadR family transcriptional regulator
LNHSDNWNVLIKVLLVAVSRNQLLVLRYLAECTTPVAGIDIAADLDWVATSSIYAAISALQAQGNISAEWDHSESHPRRMVSISTAGADALREAIELESRQLIRPRRIQEA